MHDRFFETKTTIIFETFTVMLDDSKFEIAAPIQSLRYDIMNKKFEMRLTASLR